MNTVPLPPVYSMYWNNISPTVKSGQSKVFESLNIPLIQENADQIPHGEWMQAVCQRHQSDDVIVFCDIDAFPLRHEAYLAAVAAAQSGCVFGLAQFSNHKPSAHLYAGPMFMAFRKSTWEALGSPEFQTGNQYDAAELLSLRARDKGVALDLAMPTSCLWPKWALAHQGVFGIGTFYGACDFFHLFESRRPAYEAIFDAVVSDVVSAQPLNFRHYLSLVEDIAKLPPVPRKRNWMPKPLRRFF